MNTIQLSLHLTWYLNCLLLVCAFSSQENLQKSSNRQLNTGDFAELNNLIEDAEIRLPGASLWDGFGTLNINNLVCTNLKIDDIQVVTNRQMRELEVGIQIKGLDMICRADYFYDGFLFIDATGSIYVESFNNEATTATVFTSQRFDQYPPHDSFVDQCNPVININQLDFSGSFLSFILDILEGMVRDHLENAAKTRLCDELGERSTTNLDEMLDLARQELALYYPANTNQNDPLLLEQNLVVREESVRLLNLEEKETTFGFWMDRALRNVVSYLNEEGPTAGYSGFTTDMNMNIILREHLLENGAYIFDMEDFPLDGIVYEEHNRLTKTTIQLTSMKLLGLDSLTKFDPLDNIGQYTMQSELSWENLSFELDLKVEMQASTLPNSYIGNSRSGVVEQVKVTFGIGRLDASISLLLAINQDELEALQLGSFLDTNNILPCIASSVFMAEISDLSVAAINIQPPTMSGFISPGIDRVVSSIVDAAFVMYQSSLLKAAPGYFQTVVRDILNEGIMDKYQEYSRAGCTMLEIPTPGAVDFRDLLLVPNGALLTGGSGTEPYGDLFWSFVMPNIREQMLTYDKANSRLIQPLTKNQSGVEGMITFPSELFKYEHESANGDESGIMSLWDRIEISSFNVTVQNMDTVAPPLSILHPVSANEISNSVNLGEFPSRPLTFTTRALSLVQGGGADSSLEMRNEVEIKVQVPSSAFSFVALATVDEDALTHFPLKDVTNFYCWLATIEASESSSNQRRLALKGFLVDLVSSSLQVSCVSCTSPGGEALPDIVGALEQAGFSSLLLPRAERLFEELLSNLWDNLDVDLLLEDSGRFCPHHSDYSEGAVASDYGWPGPLSLSKEGVETVLVASVLTLQAALVATAKNYLSPSNQSFVPRSNWSSPQYPNDVRILDWENLSDSVGSWAGMALDQTRLYVEEIVIDEDKIVTRRDLQSQNQSGIFSSITDIRANILMRKLLDEDGMYSINFNNFTLNFAGVNVSLARIRIWGLDSITQLEALVVAGPQSLQNHLLLEEIHIKIDFDVEHASNSTETMTVSFTTGDIDIKADMLLAMDLDKLGGIELGGILNINQIFLCMMSGLHRLHIPQLSVDIGSMGHPTVDGFISPHLQADGNSVIQTFFDTYRSDLIRSVPTIFDTILRDVINNVLNNAEKEGMFSCSLPPGVPTEGFVDFRELLLPETISREFGGQGNSTYGNLFPTLYNALKENLLDLNSTAINALVSSLTQQQSGIDGAIKILGNALETNASLSLSGLDADFALQISDVSFYNLDSLVGPLELFQPVRNEANLLNNNISFGVGGKSLRMGGRILVSLSDGVEMQIRNEVDVSVDLSTVEVFASFLLNLANDAFLSIPMRDIPNVNCWLAAIDSKSYNGNKRGIGLLENAVSIENVDLNITCVSCTSPQFDSLISKLYNFTATDIENTIGKIIDGNAFNEFLDDASRKCPKYGGAKEEQYLVDPPTSLTLGEKVRRDNESIAYIIAINGALAACLLLVLLLVKWIVHVRNRAWIDSLSKEGLNLFRKQEEREREEQAMLNSTTTSMFRSPCLPLRIRVLFPIAILTNIILYVGAHVFLLSYVDIDVQLAGETFTLYRFLEFKFFEAATNTYKNGGIEMSIMLWIFTGIWPYIKLSLSLILWFTQPRVISVSNRERVLLWLEALTKLSPVDVLTTLLAFAVILVYVGGPDEALSTDGGVLYSMKIIVVPSLGCYCIVIGQRMSRVSSRSFLDYHHQVVDAARKAQEILCITGRQISNGDYEQPTQQEKGSLGPEEDSSAQHVYADGIRVYDGTNRNMKHDDGIRVYEGTHRCTKQDCGGIIGDCPDTNIRDDKSVSSDHSGDHAGQAFHTPRRIFRKLRFDCQQNGIEAEVGYNSFPEEDRGEEEVKDLPLHRRVARFLMKNIVVSFAGLTVFVLIIIGCIYAPSVALDTTDVWHLALESGTTFDEAVAQFGVFSVVSTVLLKARFVLDTAWDYVGFGVLLAVGILSVGVTLLVGCYQFCRRLYDKGWEGLRGEQQPVYNLTSYCRLHAYKHLEIYVVSLVIGWWQLGAVASYGIHMYCSILFTAYQFLANVGLAEESTAQCFRKQILLPDNLLILFGSFLILTVNFFIQATQQYRKNVSHAYSLVHKDDKEHLSMLWDTDKLSSASLQLNDTASMSLDSSDEEPADKEIKGGSGLLAQ